MAKTLPKIKKIKGKYLISLFGLLIGTGLVLVLFLNPSLVQFLQFSSTNIIEIGDDGFTPKELKVAAGTTVTFINKKSEASWPASDLHPSHTLYPQFDPKRSLRPGEKWSLKFDKEGNWSYHDHLKPFYQGKIIVGSPTNPYKDASIEKCHGESNKTKCWNALLDKTLEDKGLEESLTLVENLYENEPEFAADCHGFIHKVGLKAYRTFNQNKEAVVTDKAYICGWGFYHAFMGSLLLTTRDIGQAREFCNLVGKKLGETKKFARSSCFHGIGHGLMGDTPLPEFGGDAPKMIAKPLELCDQVSGEDTDRYQCANGIFNVVAIFYANSSSGVKFNKSEPYQICGQQTKYQFAKACYDQMNTAVYLLGNKNLLSGAKYIEPIKEDDFAEAAMSGLAAVAGGYAVGNTKEYSQAIDDCNNVQERVQRICRESFLGGLIEAGKPNEEYVEGLVFCNNKKLDHEEKGSCITHLFDLLDDIYARETLGGICQLIEADYRKYCIY